MNAEFITLLLTKGMYIVSVFKTSKVKTGAASDKGAAASIKQPQQHQHEPRVQAVKDFQDEDKGNRYKPYEILPSESMDFYAVGNSSKANQTHFLH